MSEMRLAVGETVPDGGVGRPVLIGGGRDEPTVEDLAGRARQRRSCRLGSTNDPRSQGGRVSSLEMVIDDLAPPILTPSARTAPRRGASPAADMTGTTIAMEGCFAMLRANG